MVHYSFCTGARILATPTERISVDVLYADTDAMGIIYYGSYFRFFEAGRLAFFRRFGREITASYEDGEPVLLPVTATACRYRKPGRVYDRLEVETRLREVKRASFTLSYVIYRGETGERLVEGETEHTCIDAAGRLVRFDHRMRAFFARARGEEAEQEQA